MLTSQLPSRVEPYKLAARDERLEGQVALDRMPRLAEEAGEQTGECFASLAFGIDAQGRREIRGHVRATLSLACRRCLVPLSQDVSSDFLLGMIADEALASELPASHEPVLVENEQLDLLTVLEDELILSLPQVVYHDEAECHVSSDQLVSKTDGAADAPAPASNPFAVLGALKGKDSSDGKK
ncbi:MULTISPECIES: YceD family protein [unclassified Halomonas]|uniref:YceD family protein n=1 Tax=unclassified Halomonas TaxID=2609666 RepID=UPI0021E44F25|nr:MULTISPECIES: YceD family protein [unclassified Halomonas]UYF98496.1 YceD family protein [Halomonas sp. GD1P12]WNL40390.1 YceD family protein [Halomonas sp. PAMB 3232]WNL43722.1 YceD family protein [Halomonas sp. PAMB 3264]